MTLSAIEATLNLYLDEEEAIKKIPTLRMILEDAKSIRKRAFKIKRALKRIGIETFIKEDISMPGGGSLPDCGVKTFVVAIKPSISVHDFVKRLRETNPPVIARIKDDFILLDGRTIQEREIPSLVNALKQALSA
jgi:L-seryl-tRNA(Ser) seleniumtransferase